MGRLRILALAMAAAWCGAGCAAATQAPVATPGIARPGPTVHETLRRAIALLEQYQCETFAVEFLSPIKRAQIADVEVYRKSRQCGPDDRGNLDDVLMAMRMALGAPPTVAGVKATFDLSGIGLRVTKLEFVRYVDGLWYFNEL
jgi:hypothetical protein